MNTTPPLASPDAPSDSPSKRSKTASSTAHASSSSSANRRASAKHGRRAATGASQAAHGATHPASSPPPFDVETLFELPEASTRAIQKLVTQRPVTSLLGAFGVGFMVGGGWRTRVGRVVALAAMRHLVLQAAEHYYGT